MKENNKLKNKKGGILIAIIVVIAVIVVAIVGLVYYKLSQKEKTKHGNYRYDW